MMAASLFLLFVVAKIAILWGRPLPLSAWTPLAFLWQDLAIALLFLAFERLVRRDWAIRSIYAAFLLLIIANVPVALVLSTPLTAPMLRAARGTLSDSFWYHATPTNLIITGFLFVLGIALPWARPRNWSVKRGWVVAAVVLVLLGPFAASRVETNGLERNALVALVRTSVPRVQAQAYEADWRRAVGAGAPRAAGAHALRADRAGRAKELLHFRGSAAGSNVLLVALESTAARYLRPFGAAEDPMPNLSALAARSIVFENAYAVYPESVKGLVSILASRYPGFDLDAEQHQRLMRPSLATALSGAGYETALFHSGRFFYLGMQELVEGSGFGRLADAGDIGGNHSSSFGIDEKAAVRHILGWIDAQAGAFFAAYLPIAGHHPYAYSLPGPFPEDQEIGRYRNALHEADHALGELLEGLRARGLDRNTIVIVIGDHGEAFGQHPGNYGHNLALYEENVRVPLVISLPGETKAHRVGATASLIDVAPTILDLLGIGRPAQFEGESLLDSSNRMALFFTDYSLGLLGLRDGCTKVIHELESGRSKLFDLCVDPDERDNLASQRADEVVRYRERLRRWSAAEVARIKS